MKQHLTAEQKSALKAAFASATGTNFTERIEAAYSQVGIKLERAKLDGFYYPSMFPFLGVKKYSHAGDRGTEAAPTLSRSTAKQSTDKPRPNKKNSRGCSVGADCSLDDAVQLLCDVIALRLRASLGNAITSSALKTLPAPSVAAVAKTAADPKGVRSMTDGELRIACATARVNQNIGLFESCKSELKRRDNAAQSIAAESQEESI